MTQSPALSIDKTVRELRRRKVTYEVSGGLSFIGVHGQDCWGWGADSSYIYPEPKVESESKTHTWAVNGRSLQEVLRKLLHEVISNPSGMSYDELDQLMERVKQERKEPGMKMRWVPMDKT